MEREAILISISFGLRMTLYGGAIVFVIIFILFITIELLRRRIDGEGLEPGEARVELALPEEELLSEEEMVAISTAVTAFLIDDPKASSKAAYTRSARSRVGRWGMAGRMEAMNRFRG